MSRRKRKGHQNSPKHAARTDHGQKRSIHRLGRGRPTELLPRGRVAIRSIRHLVAPGLAVTAVCLGLLLARAQLESHSPPQTLPPAIALVPPIAGEHGRGFHANVTITVRDCSNPVVVDVNFYGSAEYWDDISQESSAKRKRGERRRAWLVAVAVQGRAVHKLRLDIPGVPAASAPNSEPLDGTEEIRGHRPASSARSQAPITMAGGIAGTCPDRAVGAR